MKRGTGFAASPAQREKCRDQLCANCASPNVDPAHLTSRAQGGCDHPDCVIALCRICHRGLDFREGPQRGIDLAPILALATFAAERSHMAGHMSFHACIRRLTGERMAA